MLNQADIIRQALAAVQGGSSWLPNPGPAGSAPDQSRNALAEAIAGIVKPEMGQPFQAPAISVPSFQQAPVQQPQQRGPIGAPMTPVDTRGVGPGNLGASYIAAGLGKLGQGIEGGFADLKAKRDQQAQIDAIKAGAGSGTIPPLGSPGSGLGGSTSSGAANPPLRPISSSISSSPTFAQRHSGAAPATGKISTTAAGPATFAQSGVGGIAAPGDVKRAVDDAFTKLGEDKNVNRSDLHDYLATGGRDLDPQTQAYCAAFVSAALQHAGITGAPSNLASDYLNWGKPVTGGVQRGDVLVSAGTVKGGVDAGQSGDHVGFATGKTDSQGRIEMISGNTQGGKVATAYIDPSSVAVRRYDRIRHLLVPTRLLRQGLLLQWVTPLH
jgi:hypothetical protein